MAAQKIVPSATRGGQVVSMSWQVVNDERVRWTAGVEVDAARVGQLFLFVNPQFERAWLFKLSLHAEEVLQWHARPLPSGHNNPVSGCPEGFARKVRSANHEHIWVENLDCRCARPIENFDLSTHERMFRSFCDRALIRFEPTYQTPPAQMSL